MANEPLPDPASQVHALFEGRQKAGWVAVWALCLAFSGHAAAAALIADQGAPQDAALEPVALEFVSPPEPEAQPQPEPEPEPQPTLAKALPPQAAPRAAAAPPVVTTDPEHSKQAGSDELVDFASDPRGTVYGGGVVAVGGLAKLGAPNARATATIERPRPAKTEPRREPTPPAPPKLSRKARLDETDPCRGFFPSAAQSDVANASVRIGLAANGRVERATVVSESPAGQGFGAAARSCMLSKRFSPALDEAGTPVPWSVKVNVRFRR